MAFAGMATANAEQAIQIYDFGNSAEPKQTALSDVKKVVFDAEGLSVVKYSTEETEVYDYTEVRKIAFGDYVGVQSISAVSDKVVISPNPVKTDFKLVGAENLKGSELCIYAITGQLVKKVAAWEGETIDASDLPQGIYLLTINSTTIKFVKL